MLTHKQLRTPALADAAVKAKIDEQSDEFSLLDEFLKARTSQGLTQAQVAKQNEPPSLPWRKWLRAVANTRHRWRR